MTHGAHAAETDRDGSVLLAVGQLCAALTLPTVFDVIHELFIAAAAWVVNSTRHRGTPDGTTDADHVIRRPIKGETTGPIYYTSNFRQFLFSLCTLPLNARIYLSPPPPQ